MSDAPPTLPSRMPPNQIQRMAWAIVWMAFAMFCGVCIGTTVAVYAFLFYSVAPLNVEAQVGKGTVVISSADAGERGQRNYEPLPVRPARLSTDTLSQATLVISTGEGANIEFVASITLKNNSEVLLRRANRPRFDWSTGAYEIELADLRGDIDVVVGDIGSRPIKFQIFTRRGEKITLTKPGRYAISVTDLRVQVSNRRGEAILSSPEPEYNLLLPEGQDGLLYAGRAPVTAPQRINLIDHGLFIFDALNTTDDGLVRMPTHWGCANAARDLPRGQYTVEEWRGRTALHLFRGDNATTNGETRCKQPYYPEWDISSYDYNFLELETTFLIEYQSISECGIEGSECPLMLHLIYTDVNGIERDWYQGFYATLDPLYDSYKSRCASCIQDHQQINEKVWYTYESGNLFYILPEEVRPAKIKQIEFYASGHQYNVYVGEISLFAGITDAVLPDGTAPIGPS